MSPAVGRYEYEQFFPFPTIRNEQRQAIEFTLDAFLKQNKRFVILEMGTGCGKSAVGITVAGYLQHQNDQHDVGSYVLTTQKILQEQYVNDFGPDGSGVLRSIKSASNYSCLHYPNQSCGESRHVLYRLGKFVDPGFEHRCKTCCPYASDKKSFLSSPVGVTNFSYFYAETMYSCSNEFMPRQLLIIDECHNIESQTGKFVEIVISERFALETLKVPVVKLVGSETDMMVQAFEWVKAVYRPRLVEHIDRLEKKLKRLLRSGVCNISKYTKLYETLDNHVCKLNRFIDFFEEKNWILNLVRLQDDKGTSCQLEFKPVDVSSYVDDMLYRFGKKVLLMSATVLDADIFCRTAGINPKDAAFIRITSPFPVSNRPIVVIRVGSMSLNNIELTLPNMVEAIRLLLEYHANDKGIIHCVSFKVARYIFEHVVSDRLLMHDSNNRDDVLKQHVNETRPTVLLSPSMMEGVDLADDVSRFQVMCKVPFPYLGDQVVRRRKKNDVRWYEFQTAKTIIQALGRSIRSSDDFAVSYILDADWEGFYRRNRQLFPKDFSQLLSVGDAM